MILAIPQAINISGNRKSAARRYITACFRGRNRKAKRFLRNDRKLPAAEETKADNRKESVLMKKYIDCRG